MNSTEFNKVQTIPVFRKDINALRAWAVVSVLLYHFGVPGFSGGFVGVDVFFVISGFLITGIALKSLELGRFSLLKFYFSRVRRIIPALVVLCSVLLVIGWILLAPDDYSKLAEHAKDTLFFVSNQTYRNESGYFDSDAHEKWLLHSWSLSVEWQFYILFPVSILCLWKINKSQLFIVSIIFLSFVISLFLCVDKTPESASKAFYFLKYRYWELLAGALAYFFSSRINVPGYLRFIFVFLGFLLFGFSVNYFNPDTQWPGWHAMIPVLAGFLIVFANRQDFKFNNYMVIQWIGVRSYSIYLWHWPLVILLAYFDRLNIFSWVFCGVLGSFFLGELSYRFVETPARNAYGIGDTKASLLIIFCAALVVAASHLVIEKKGFPWRVSSKVAQLRAEKNNVNRRGNECVADNKPVPPSCIYGGEKIRAIVLGDSHANTMVTGVAAALRDSSEGVYYWGHLACPFIKGVSGYKGCSDFNDWALQKMHELPSDIPLIVISRFSYYAFGGNEGRADGGSTRPPVYFSKKYDRPDPEFLDEFSGLFLETVCAAAKTRQVYLIKPVPELKLNVPQVMARAEMMGRGRRVSISLAEYYRRHAFILALEERARDLCGIKILDPLPYLCDNERCYGDSDGWPLYFDDDHLSEFGNKRVAAMYEPVFGTK